MISAITASHYCVLTLYSCNDFIRCVTPSVVIVFTTGTNWILLQIIRCIPVFSLVHKSDHVFGLHLINFIFYLEIRYISIFHVNVSIYLNQWPSILCIWNLNIFLNHTTQIDIDILSSLDNSIIRIFTCPLKIPIHGAIFVPI